MKKITLVLCACAMAFAGLLVSCSNSTGDEQIIFRGETSYDYAYAVSGTEVTTTKDSNSNESSDYLATTVVTKTFKNGTATLAWSENDDETTSVTCYTLNVQYGNGDKETSYAFSGDIYTANKAFYDRDSNYVMNNALGSKTFYFYSIGDKFYDNTTVKFDENGSTYTTSADDKWTANAKTEDEEKAEVYTYEVTGKPTDDKITIKITYKNYDNDDADAKTVDNKYTVYTFNLVKFGSEE